MALSSLVLVLTDHHHNPDGADRLVSGTPRMTHLGLLAIVLALVVLAHESGGDSFAAMRAGASRIGPVAASVVFVLALVGFGSKAGVVPVHVWLPRAHPEAPSHVSALMSGAMVKLGVYGLVRVGWDLLGGGPGWWGAAVLGVGLRVGAVRHPARAGRQRPQAPARVLDDREHRADLRRGRRCRPVRRRTATGRWRRWRWPRRCCTWSTTRRSRGCCSWGPVRC